MENINIIFIVMSVVALVYILVQSFAKKKIPLVMGMFFGLVYACVLVIFLFPQVLRSFEQLIGIDSAINFFLYLSIFFAYLFLFLLYRRSEKHREEITKCVREMAKRK